MEALAGSWVFNLVLLFFELLLTVFGLMASILLAVISIDSFVSDGADLFLELMSVIWVSELSSEFLSVPLSTETITLSSCELSSAISMSSFLLELPFFLRRVEGWMES